MESMGATGWFGVRLFLGLDHASAPAVDQSVEALQPARGEEPVPAPGTCAEHADLAADIGQRAEVGVRAIEIAQHPSVRRSPRRAHLGPDILGRAIAVAEVQVRRDRHVAVVSEAASALAIPLVPARRVVDEHHAGKGAGAERSGKVRVDEIPVVPPHGHRLGDHAFVLIGLVHVHLPSL